jgi:hypothetical protein
MHTVIIRHHGSDWHYTCEGPHAALILFHALTKTFTRVEMWRGTEMVECYDNT